MIKRKCYTETKYAILAYQSDGTPYITNDGEYRCEFSTRKAAEETLKYMKKQYLGLSKCRIVKLLVTEI